MLEANVFTRVSVYPHQPEGVLIEWELHPKFNPIGSYTFTVEYSRSGNQNSGEWSDLGTVTNKTGAMFLFKDLKKRAYSTFALWFYRIRLDVGSHRFYSEPISSLGSLNRQDNLIFQKIVRDETLRLCKKVGHRGYLLRRKYWGERASTVSTDTYEVLNPTSTEDYGTGFKGGYWQPMVFWVDINANNVQKVVKSEIGTLDNKAVVARGLAFPLPRSNDIWVDCATGLRHRIDSVSIIAKVRHLPVVTQFQLNEIPPTHVIYQFPLTKPDDDDDDISYHWDAYHWNPKHNPYAQWR